MSNHQLHISWTQVQPFIPEVRTLVSRRVPASEREDVLQDVLLRLHKASLKVPVQANARAWVLTISHRAIADYYRRRYKTPEILEEDVEVAYSDQSYENLAAYKGNHGVHEEILSWLRPMAEALPESYREPLLMADFEGCSQKEVAAALGLSLSGAKSRVQRARKLLGRTLQSCCDVEFGSDGRAVSFVRHKRSD